MICETCHGQGMLWDKSPRPCPQCGGCGTDYCCGPSAVPDVAQQDYFSDDEISVIKSNMKSAIDSAVGIRLERSALAFVKAAHESVNQKRKYTGENYIVHPIAVAEIVRSVPHTPEMIAAAYLHDAIEDTNVTREDIAAKFGEYVAELVWWLSDQSKPSDGNRKVRKEIDRQHIAKAPAAAKTIKLADLIDNTRTIKHHDPDFWRVYRREKLRLLEVLKEGDSSLWARAAAQCES